MNLTNLSHVELMYYINDALVGKKQIPWDNIIKLVNIKHDKEISGLLRFICGVIPAVTSSIIDYCILDGYDVMIFVDHGLITPDAVLYYPHGNLPIIIRAALSNQDAFHNLVLAGANMWSTYFGKSIAYYVETQLGHPQISNLIHSGLIIPPCRIQNFQNIGDQIAMLYNFIFNARCFGFQLGFAKSSPSVN
jgi:hypothetical protein